jgi:hypothetical protein
VVAINGMGAVIFLQTQFPLKKLTLRCRLDNPTAMRNHSSALTVFEQYVECFGPLVMVVHGMGVAGDFITGKISSEFLL